MLSKKKQKSLDWWKKQDAINERKETKLKEKHKKRRHKKRHLVCSHCQVETTKEKALGTEVRPRCPECGGPLNRPC